MDPNSYVALAASLTLGAVMLWAGVAKARNYPVFASTVSEYASMPAQARRIASFLLPAAEAALGFALISQEFPVIAAACTAILITAVSAVTLRQFGFRGNAVCGCFGSSEPRTVKALLRRNAGLALLAVAIVASSLRDGGPFVFVAATATLLAVAVLVGEVAWPPSGSPSVIRTNDGPTNPRRRTFLGRVALGGAVAMGAALLRAPRAEAACAGCGTCADQYIYLGCSSPCCALYLVRRRKSCDGGCEGCSSWWQQEFCGIPGCGC